VSRQIALTKRVSLAEFSEGWEDCYVLVRPASYKEALEFGALDLKSLTQAEQLEIEMDFIITHFVSGKIQVFDDGEVKSGTTLTSMEADDVKASVPMANKIFFEILGIAPDPKGTATVATSKSEPSS
jgi:hypothetical protein